MKNLCVIIFLQVITLTNLQAQTTSIQEKLDELSRLGIQYKYLDETTIELSDSLTGYRSIKTIKETNTQEIYNWAQSKDIPVIDFNPALIDTSKWTGWYDYWTYVPISNGSVPFPVWIEDFDGNGFQEVYGIFGLIGMGESRVFEVYPDGHTVQRHNYSELPATASTQILDLDKNGLIDLVLVSGQNSYIYEQPTATSIPTQSKFTFRKYDGLANVLSREKMVNMDGDSLIDFVHRGADTSISPYYLMYISEYNPSIQNFEKKWYIEPTIEPNIGF